MTHKSLSDWWDKTHGKEHKPATERDYRPEDVEELYDRLGREPKVDASVEIIRKEMAAVYRDMRAGRIDCNDGTRLAYVLDLLRKTHETNVVKERLGALERAVGVRPDDSSPDWLGIPFEDAG
jgi:hypothetical protein